MENLKNLPKPMARSGLTKVARRAFVGLTGKAGAKAVLGFAKPFLKRLPIIGALIDFGLSVALGEDFSSKCVNRRLRPGCRSADAWGFDRP